MNCCFSVFKGKCPNCFVMERQLQSKILELRDKEVVTIEMQQLCAKMEQQLVQQVDIRITSRCTLKSNIHRVVSLA